jgi:hypothetical protein
VSETVNASREQIADAVFALLQNVPGLRTVSRRTRLPTQIGQNEMPALFLWGDGVDLYTKEPRGAGLRRVYEMHAVLLFVSPHQDGDDRTGAEVMHPLLDEIERVVTAPDDFLANANTLGGMVERCWIEGEVVKATGDTDPKGIGAAVVPIKVMVP